MHPRNSTAVLEKLITSALEPWSFLQRGHPGHDGARVCAVGTSEQPASRRPKISAADQRSGERFDAVVQTTWLTLCSEDFAGARVAELIRRREHSGRTHFPSDRWRRSLVLGTPSALAPMSCGIQPGVHLQPQLTGAVRSSRDAASPRRPSSSTSQGASIPSFAPREKPLHTSDRYLATSCGLWPREPVCTARARAVRV